MAVALLRFNFVYADLIRWLQGPYTNAHRDWDDVFTSLEHVTSTTARHGHPPVDFDRAYRLASEGAPLRGHFNTTYTDVAQRNLRPINKDLLPRADEITEKIRKEEQLSYHLILPRFLFRFIHGLHLCLLQYIKRPEDTKGRLCIDHSTQTHPHDTGNANRLIPKPGTPGKEDENRPIYYGTAFMRYLTWLWNLRISYPNEEIYQLADDISAAFHRILYHPAMAPVFASVWAQHLIIPVGSIFGAHDSPSNYMVFGELRSHYDTHMTGILNAPLTDLANQVTLAPPLTPLLATNLEQAYADEINPGILRPHDHDVERQLPSFVDDSGNAHIHKHFRLAVNASVIAAYTIFGHPHEDPTRPPCINPSKWTPHATHLLTFLGYTIDSRKMIIIWPLAKRQKLDTYITTLLDQQAQHGSPPKQLAKVLGLVQHGSFTNPNGKYSTLRLQYHLNDAVSQAPLASKSWWKRNHLRLPPHIMTDLRILRSSLDSNLYHHMWNQPIGLVVPRQPTFVTRTDASLNGMGGYCERLDHKWRLSHQDLLDCGFPAGDQYLRQYEEINIDPNLDHINVYEFVALFIELWICVRPLHKQTDHLPGGERSQNDADNCTCLSWLRYAARST